MKSEDLYLWDVYHAAEKILRYIDGKTAEEFAADEILFDAVVREFQVLSEATNRLSEKRKERYSLPWKAMIGFRNVIVHDYDGLNPLLVWTTATQDLPDVIRVLSPEADRIRKRIEQ